MYSFINRKIFNTVKLNSVVIGEYFPPFDWIIIIIICLRYVIRRCKDPVIWSTILRIILDKLFKTILSKSVGHTRIYIHKSLSQYVLSVKDDKVIDIPRIFQTTLSGACNRHITILWSLLCRWNFYCPQIVSLLYCNFHKTMVSLLKFVFISKICSTLKGISGFFLCIFTLTPPTYSAS